MAPAATPVPMLNCVTMLEKLVAELICGFGISAKAIVLRLVNCIERHKPFTNKTAENHNSRRVGCQHGATQHQERRQNPIYDQHLAESKAP